MKIKKAAPNLLAKMVALLTLTGFSGYASALILEDISVREEKDEVVLTIQLATPVQYKRHAPVREGETLDIYYQLVPGAATNLVEENEVRLSPPSDLISDFTVASKLENGETELVIQFDRNLKYRVSSGKDNRSFSVYVKKSSIGKVEKARLLRKDGDLPEIKPQAADDQNTKQAEALMTEGRNALQAGNFAAAIEAFNKLLQLPSSKYTQDAQEWVGVAREGAGQPDRAKLEYESYLKQYTSGAGVARVKERLANLPTAAQPVAAERPAAEEKKGVKRTVYGSVGMHYYHGASNVDTTTTNITTNTLTQSAFTNTDQSSLITDLDLSERFRSDTYDNKLVFRDSFTKNYLSGQASRNRLNSAYFELKNKVADVSARLGRQTPTGGGVLGRFDGISGGAGLAPKWRANAVAGRLVDTSAHPVTQPVFYGASLDMLGTAGGGWSGSLYAINQTLESFSDRRAVGAELRYFETDMTAFALLDYDTSYSALNTALVQGTYNLASGTSFNFMVDRRKTPSMSTRNALNGATTSSLGVVLQSMTMAEVRALAKARTATATLSQLGVTHPMTEKWQVGGDIKLSKVSSMPASGTTELVGILPETPATGNEWTLTGQLIGSNILSARDITVLSFSRITSPSINAQSFFVSNRSMVARWTYDASLRLYRQDNFGITTTRTSPTFKITYQAREKVNLEVEAGMEATNSSGNGTSSKTTRKFYSLGFRWDF